MPKLSPYELDELPAERAAAVLHRRFPWADKARLQKWIAWQESSRPRPNFYFRWHLGRLAATCECLQRAARGQATPRILDVGAYAPYSLLLERELGRGSWTRTSFDAYHEEWLVDGIPWRVSNVSVDLDRQELPFDAQSFDVVLLTEVVEHVNRHPQRVFAEINRVLAGGGRFVLTTPNVGSLKKAMLLTDGQWAFDSPTFPEGSHSWGHRYEFSYYHIRETLRLSGFTVLHEAAKDVYPDDPSGVVALARLTGIAAGQVLSGGLKQAARFISRRGSGLFFVAEKTGQPEMDKFLTI